VFVDDQAPFIVAVGANMSFFFVQFIDRTAGVCGVCATQIIFGSDPLVQPLFKEFEEAVYANL